MSVSFTSKQKIGAVLVLIMAAGFFLYTQGYPARWREPDEPEWTGAAPPTNTSDPPPQPDTPDEPPEPPEEHSSPPEPIITLLITPDEPFSPLPEQPIKP